MRETVLIRDDRGHMFSIIARVARRELSATDRWLQGYKKFLVIGTHVAMVMASLSLTSARGSPRLGILPNCKLLVIQ